MKIDIVWGKTSQPISMKFYQKTSFSICYNFPQFWIYEDSYISTFPSPLQLVNISRATKGETWQFWFHAKQLVPFQTIFYYFYCMFDTVQDFILQFDNAFRFRINWIYLFLHCNHNIYQYFHLHGAGALKRWDELSWWDLDLFQSKMYQVQGKNQNQPLFSLFFLHLG